MSGRSFLDTDLLVYTDDQDSPEKQRRALELVSECRRRRSGVVSTQVLQEYFVTATRKLGVAADVARRKTEIFGGFDIVTLGLGDVLGAIDLHRLHRLSFWDALVVRAALASGCTRLLSEDLQHGQRFEGLEIVNPFGQ
jgi:predicted nucleic acid-binding protein